MCETKGRAGLRQEPPAPEAGSRRVQGHAEENQAGDDGDLQETQRESMKDDNTNLLYVIIGVLASIVFLICKGKG